jgi:hypothetical protein
MSVISLGFASAVGVIVSKIYISKILSQQAVNITSPLVGESYNLIALL